MKKNKFKYILSVLMAMVLTKGAVAQEVVTDSNPEMHYYLLTAVAIILLVVIIALNGAIKNMTTGKALWENTGNNNAATILAIVFTFFGSQAFAQNAAQDMVIVEPNYGLVFWLFLLVDLVLLIIVFVQLSVLSGLVNTIKGAAAAEDEYVEIETGFDRFWKGLTNATPIEREAEIMTDHEYDGIKELDNVLPPWWLWLFYLSIVFAVVYFGYYEVYQTTDMSMDEYQAEMLIAKEKAGAKGINISNVVIMEEESNLANGQKVFEANCASCHLIDGGGSIGPNLTDHYWKNGGSVQDVFKTVEDGIKGTAMVPWKALISPNDRQDVVSYILVNLQGSTPAVGKDPEGELYNPE
jgi:cytochrome c oxidase cbb3-type subunit 3